MGPLKILEVFPGGTYKLDLPPNWSRMHNGFNSQVLRPFLGLPDTEEQAVETTTALGGQSPCIGLSDEVGSCTVTHRKIGKSGYCVSCHKQAMLTYGLPMRCTAYSDHRVTLPDGFVPQLTVPVAPNIPPPPLTPPPPPVVQRTVEPVATVEEELEDVPSTPSSTPPAQPAPHAGLAVHEDEGEVDIRRAIVARNNRLREARMQARARNKER